MTETSVDWTLVRETGTIFVSPTMAKTGMWVELTCADPRVAFRGEWPGPEGPEEILAFAREKATASGLPVQVEIQGHGVWSIEPTGKVHPGRLFRPEKLPGAKGKKQRDRTTRAP